jgi:hypothetical protein
MTQPTKTYQTSSARLLIGLLALVFSAGCGPGTGQGLDQDGNLVGVAKPDNVVGASGNPNSTLAWVRTNVFVGICSQCHTGGTSAPFGVDWTASHICDNVGRQSGEMSALKEIESGNPDASYVIWKVQGAGPNGEAIAVGTGRMPLGLTPLDTATIQNMRDWIADGVLGC